MRAYPCHHGVYVRGLCSKRAEHTVAALPGGRDWQCRHDHPRPLLHLWQGNVLRADITLVLLCFMWLLMPKSDVIACLTAGDWEQVGYVLDSAPGRLRRRVRK